MKKCQNTLQDRKCPKCNFYFIDWFTTEFNEKGRVGDDVYHCRNCDYLFWWDDKELTVCAEPEYMQSIRRAGKRYEEMSNDFVSILDKYNIFEIIDNSKKPLFGKKKWNFPIWKDKYGIYDIKITKR